MQLTHGNMEVDQSVLTGESTTVEKSGGEVAYSGSAVKRGEATGVVNATGTRTYFGKTVELVSLAKPKLHMEDFTVKVARRLGMIIVVSLLVAFAYAALTGFQFAGPLPLAGTIGNGCACSNADHVHIEYGTWCVGACKEGGSCNKA